MKLPKSIRDQFAAHGRRGGLAGGSIGGTATAARMTPEQKAERARKGVAARLANLAKRKAK